MTADFKSADAFITTPDGRVLLQLREDAEGIPWPGWWAAPGGRRDGQETPYENARRELLEETGLDVEGLLPFDVVHCEDDDPRRRFFHAVVDVDPEELVLGEGQELRLVTFAEAREMHVTPHCKEYLRQLEGHLRVGRPRVWAAVDRLHARLKESVPETGNQFLTLQVLKIQEEAGEAAQALLGVLGANPRKGVSHTLEQLQGELCDVIATAMIALRETTPDAASVLSEHVRDWGRW
ncbi:NUDIX domain-containing protein [Kitasatospora sp. NPDC056446]|uniref:NUDIX domain-containing protein n=1 Tax=Kitasatospora sp. NPDC056446 TaxID=3345819 RepID=UPI00367846AE